MTSSPPVTNLKLSEIDLYGSSRLGNLAPNDLLVTTASGAPPVSNIPPHFRQLGDKNYELSNHLGNVLAVLTDRKLQVDAGADGTADYFMPDMLNASDYYAFGQPYRKYSVANRYRYGFNGKENDPETVGT